MKKCCICDKPISEGEETVTLRSKGSEGVNRASIERGSDLRTVAGDEVHVECRRIFCKPDSIAHDKASTSETLETGPGLRSAKKFNFQEHCLYCGQPAQIDKKRKETDVFQVRIGDYQKTLKEICHSRNDEWSKAVLGRLAYIIDLHSADAIYHQQCSSNFRTGKNIPIKLSADTCDKSKKSKVGRPESSARTNAFLKVVEFLEQNQDEQMTVNDLVQKMAEYLENTEHEPYSVVYMKTKLRKQFGDRIIMTDLPGKQCVVTLCETASSILYKFHQHQKHAKPEDEKLNIIKTAAKLIESEVKSTNQPYDVYPSNDEFSSRDSAVDLLPLTLQVLLKTMFAGKNVDLKLASIGQCIMQAIRPRAILAPLQLGLGVQMHHHFASRFLIDTLHELGFSCSYAEVKRYERSAAVVQGTEIPGYTQDHQLQHVADNVDHNVATIDGSGTFHGMGIVATVTPNINALRKQIAKKNVTAEDLAAVGRINIEYYKIPSHVPPLTYLPLGKIYAEDPTADLEILWNTSLLLSSPRPAWSGLMQMLHHGDYPGQSSIMFLPMIDMNPGDPSCIYSTLQFVTSQAKQHKVTPVLTFDQPLYWKALTIIQCQSSESDLKKIVLRLGGFHMEMSFLGSIGHLMAGTGLQELLEVVYASNTVPHMLSGKAVTRAVRGHLLVDAALNTILLADLYNVPVPKSDAIHTSDMQETEEKSTSTTVEGDCASEMEEDTVTSDLTTAAKYYNEAVSTELPTEESNKADVLERICQKLEDAKSKMSMPTSKVWIQYMQMVAILRRFLKAERTGNWELHLQSVREMLPFWAASGHNLYTKSAYVYLQMMLDLPESHPDVYKMFMQGYHVVRRSDRYWAGLSTDLIIEQVLMRSVKTHGGLTRGKGMSETQRLIWVLSMPACADINETMQKLTGVKYETSDQHKDISTARQVRDTKDTLALIDYLRERDPFAENDSLFNIANGMSAKEGVNVEQTGNIGERILSSMTGKAVDEYTFKKADQVVTLASHSTVKVKGESVRVDPQLIFQRLVTIGEHSDDDLMSLFKYELCSYPPALFDASSLPLQANKAALADALWKAIEEEQRLPTGDVQYVLDGGALLHRLPWPRGSTFDGLCEQYVKYVTQKYGTATVVFDGYTEEPTTKDVTHLRRTGAGPGVAVHFSGSMILQSKKEEFLANEANKQRFIHFLSDKLERAGCFTLHAKHDADLLIVQTAVAAARTKDSVLVGDDTDLLVLALHHTEINSHDLFFAPEPKQSSKKTRVWCINQAKELLGPSVCDHVLFIHAMMGCDTTSRLFGLGKGLPLKKIKNDALFQQQARVFGSTDEVNKQAIIEAGEKAMVALYGGAADEDLDMVRYRRFCEKVSKSASHVEPQTLPPTSAAAKYHSLRVFYQVVEWRGANSEMKPEDWGWHITDGKFFPTQTDQPPAPSKLLDVICCNCKKDCNTRRCTCRKYGMPCSAACGECHGISCTNCQKPDFTEDFETE